MSVLPDPNLTRIGPRQFIELSLQLGLALGIAILYRIELDRGFGTIAWIIMVGFLVHSWLPVRGRLPLFVGLTLTAIGLLLRQDGIWLVLLGAGLIGLCHIPVSWWIRLILVLLAGLGLAAVQAGMFPFGGAGAVIPVLAAMFMFRLALYLYDLKDDRTPAGFWPRVAYFFMLPNVCFPLFPVVDYKTFLDTYYDAGAAEIYQKGIFWILRGLSHLLMYRVVYYLLPSAQSDLDGALGVYVFMAMTYGLYLRVSGLFHLITGILCLFGFNLPRTNNHYFLASSFNDLWRRINIYWKDFMMKLVFYPVFMGLRRVPMDVRLVLSTAAVFVVTWFLHSYQWFWLQGRFPVATTDLAFWGFLGVALALNSIWEAHHRRSTLEKASWSWRRALGLSIRTTAVFSTMAVFWALWYSDSGMEWVYRLSAVRESALVDWLLLAGLLTGLILFGTAGQWLSHKKWGLYELENLALKNARLVVPAASAALLIISLPYVHAQAGGRAGERLVSKLKSNEPNQIDLDRQERGYYETLSRSTTFASADVPVPAGEDADALFRHTDAVRNTADIRGYEIVPGASIVFRGSTLHANRWGMRDRDYDREKAPGVYRIALLGSSHVMGWGVNDDQTFENVAEDRLNRESASDSVSTEILNFAVAGYALPQAVYVAEKIVPGFQPDMVIYVVHPREGERLVKRLRILITGFKGEVGADFEYVSRILDEAEAHVGLPPTEFERRLAPFRQRLLESSLQRMAASIRAQGATPVLLLVPLTDEGFGNTEVENISRMAADAGFRVLPLTDTYRGYDPERIRMSETDNHPNPLGHRLIAEKLEAALAQPLGRSTPTSSRESSLMKEGSGT